MTGILSTCAVCGAEVATKACARCKTLYCSQHCQAEHWASGHKKLCKKIQRGGGAEQFHADAKFKEAADAAVAACAAEGVPQDAECFICKSSIKGKGIVRGCACRGTMGLAHVGCLVWQGEMAMTEEEECGTGEGLLKWQKCFDCGQDFHGHVFLALGWACWKAYFAARIFRGRVAATPRLRRADGSRRCRGCDARTGRGDAAAATRIIRGRVAATPRLQRGYSAETRRGDVATPTWTCRGDGSRRRRGYNVDIPRAGI